MNSGFTVIGVYELENGDYQRFAEHYPVDTWVDAERQAVEENPDLIVSGIIPGNHKCVDEG